MITFKIKGSEEVSQKTEHLSQWRLGQIIKIEGFGSGNWTNIEFRGDAKSGIDTINPTFRTSRPRFL
jgi:hypothetical protein